MTVGFVNNAGSQLAVAAQVGSLELIVLPGHGERFPKLEHAGDWFPVVLDGGAGQLEVCHCTARNGDALTVDRGVEGTVERFWQAGTLLELRITPAALIEKIRSNTADTTTGA